MARKWWNVVLWTKKVLRQFLIFSLLFVVIWNCSKVPYYIGFDANGDTSYEKGGLSFSINLSHWVKGYQWVKLHTPACNFLLVHIAFSSTVLIMFVLSLINNGWRKKYGYYYFAFTILLGAHAFPAAWTMNRDLTKYSITLLSVMVIIASLFGFYTLKRYDTDPGVAEKSLLIEYSVIGASSGMLAGGTEAYGIISGFLYKMENGAFKDYGNAPDPLFGNSVYDIIPEKIGLAFFFVFTAIVWVWWPIKLLQNHTDKTNIGTEEEVETAHLLSR